MSSADFWHRLNEEVSTPPPGGRRHIIRFSSRTEFQRYLRLRAERRKELPGLSQVQQLAIIHAISCPLGAGFKSSKLPGFLSIEVDAQIELHSPVGLAPRKVSTPRGASHTIPWGVRHIRAPDIWARSTGRRVKIGVIDTGIDFFHPDLRGRISHGIHMIHRSMLPHDDNGHGTHIAGTIAASGSSGGMTGVAPNAVIHPVKAFDHNGTAYVSDIIAGIEWCVRNRLDIINMSFGMRQYSVALHDAVRRAHQAGVVIVASSGNDGKGAALDYPARFPHTISVGATTRTNRIAPFSNRGRDIDIYAPGDKIHSTWVGGRYNELSGTSMATSHVSGVVALMKELRPDLTPGEIKTALRSGAGTIRSSKTRATLRRGLDALKTMRWLKR